MANHYISDNLHYFCEAKHQLESMASKKDRQEKSGRVSIGKEKILETLTEWRRQKAESQEIPEYMVLWNESLRDIANKEPLTIDELSGINRISGAFIAKYGDTVIQMITCPAPAKEKKTKERRSPAFVQQVEKFKSGMSIEEIAIERGIQPGTVVSNLYRGVKHGYLEITDLVSQELYDKVQAFVNSHPHITNTTQMREAMGCICDYGLVGHLMQKRDEDIPIVDDLFGESRG